MFKPGYILVKNFMLHSFKNSIINVVVFMLLDGLFELLAWVGGLFQYCGTHI